MGECIINTGEICDCIRKEASCALECLRQLTGKSNLKVNGKGEVCQKDCAIDSAKCMIQTFDMEKCIKEEGACALDCLKSVHSPHVRSLKCSAC
jgi:hypothetical protein